MYAARNTLVEQDLKPNQRAAKYRAIAAEIRTAASASSLEESRAALLALANSYERMAAAADTFSRDSGIRPLFVPAMRG
jgi:hypothetical protein